ncbi:MAG: aromatic acid exporter family protein, partial [Acholeplasmataceae bacterium]
MRVIHTAIKMTLVTLMAGLISKWIGLDYWLTGGVLALLSIQLTKKDSITIGIKRIVDVFFAMILSTLLFVLLGYEFWVFIVVTFIFSLASFRLKISEGIVPALVIVTHLLIHGSFSFDLF